MPTSSPQITTFRGRMLRWLTRFWFSHISTYTWWRQLRPTAWQGVVWIASIYRLSLRRVVFIGVTGSCGKTTTKEMIAAVLSSQFKGHKNHGNDNVLIGVIQTILLTRREHNFC